MRCSHKLLWLEGLVNAALLRSGVRGKKMIKETEVCSVLYHCVMLKKLTEQQASIVKLLGHFCTIYRTPVERIQRTPSSDDAPVPAGKTTVPKTLSFLTPFFLWGCQGWALTTGYHFNGKFRDHFNIVGFQVVELLALEGQYWRTKPLQKAILSSEEDHFNAGVFDEYYIPLWNTAAPCPRDSFGKPFFICLPLSNAYKKAIQCLFQNVRCSFFSESSFRRQCPLLFPGTEKLIFPVFHYYFLVCLFLCVCLVFCFCFCFFCLLVLFVFWLVGGGSVHSNKTIQVFLICASS